MKQEDKQLLFQDLCTRLPYGVVYQASYYSFPAKELRYSNERLKRCEITTKGEYGVGCNAATLTSITKVKPFLRPMSSMTEEEKVEYCDLQDKFLLSSQYPVTDGYALFDWLNKKMFDYRGLIERNLAIDCSNLNIYD